MPGAAPNSATRNEIRAVEIAGEGAAMKPACGEIDADTVGQDQESCKKGTVVGIAHSEIDRVCIGEGEFQALAAFRHMIENEARSLVTREIADADPKDFANARWRGAAGARSRT
jgi:hypothetical protein